MPLTDAEQGAIAEGLFVLEARHYLTLICREYGREFQTMIHFTCDCCQRPIDPDEESRYVVRLEVYPAIDSDCETGDDELDNLQAIDDMLERMDDLDRQDDEFSGYEQVRYDLCERCRHEFLKNPLGRLAMAKIGFSEN